MRHGISARYFEGRRGNRIACTARIPDEPSGAVGGWSGVVYINLRRRRRRGARRSRCPIFRTCSRFLPSRVIKFDPLAFRSRYTDRIIRPDFIRRGPGQRESCLRSLYRDCSPVHASVYRSCARVSFKFVGVRGQLDRVKQRPPAEYRIATSIHLESSRESSWVFVGLGMYGENKWWLQEKNMISWFWLIFSFECHFMTKEWYVITP